MESILESILYVDHINMILYTFYFVFLLRPVFYLCTARMKEIHSSPANSRNLLIESLENRTGLADFGYIP